MTPRPRAEDQAYRGGDKLRGKVALITGGDSGIGRAVAEVSSALREAIAPYIDLVTLRRLAAAGEDIRQSIRLRGEVPAEIEALLDPIKALLHPSTETISTRSRVVR